jgi:hypothetical protein
MLDIEHPSTVEQVPKPRRAGLIALLAVVVLAGAGVGTWLLVRGDGPTGIGVIQDYAAAMRADDMASVDGFDATTVDGGFIEWQIATRAEPVFSDCSEVDSTLPTTVTCTVTYGPDYFYGRVLGETLTTSIAGRVDEDGVSIGPWPPPLGLTNADYQFRTWVRDAHPELEDQMWGPPGYLGIKMTRESGELRMQLLDEYLASLT